MRINVPYIGYVILSLNLLLRKLKSRSGKRRTGDVINNFVKM